MASRTKFVHIINRTTEPLDCMFDGVPAVVPPGYKFIPDPDGALDDKGQEKGTIVGAGRDGEPLAYTCTVHEAECYKRQHPVMGTQNPNSTDANDTDYLLGVEAWGDDIDHVEQSDAIELIDRSQLPEDRQNIRVREVSGARRIPNKKGAKARKQKLIQKARRRAAFEADNHPSPFGIKTQYEDRGR